MGFVPHIAENLKQMDERLFRDEPLGLHFETPSQPELALTK
jgi:acyl CoA:acetate/3-ketoacid CoA transferase